MHRQIFRVVSILLMSALLPAGVIAEQSVIEPQAVVGAMRSALFNAQPQSGRMTISVRTDSGEQAQWQADYLQQRREDGGYTLMVMREPDTVAGIALLTKSSAAENRAWVYVPSVRRTRELDALESDTRFLFSDMTYGDLGMFERRATELTVSMDDGGGNYVIERVPADAWQISRIKTWLSRENSLPLRREFYDRAGRLWKEATYTHAEIEGVPTIVGIKMRDVQGGGETTIERHDVGYADSVDASHFSPDELWRMGERRLDTADA